MVPPENGIERRRHQRIQHRMVARFHVEGKTQRGVILNHSESGLFLQAQKQLRVGTAISLQIAAGVMVLQGRVVWVRKPPSESELGVPGGMGIELLSPPKEYLDLVETLLEEKAARSRRKEERHDLCHRVQFESGAAFLTEYTENLSRGGMYLATEEFLKPDTIIRAHLEVPGMDEPIEVKGKVAYRLDPSEAEKRGHMAGVGIQFVELDEETKNRLHQYLKRLQIHRHTRERRYIGRISRSGFLSDSLVPELLVSLLDEKATGQLVLERGRISKLVYFKTGQPIYIESNVRDEMLGQFLLRQGKITAADFEESLEEMEKRKLRHGEILVQMGKIDGPTMALALVEHQEEKLANTFPWFDGTYHFHVGTNWPSNISIFSLRTYQIIFSGIQCWYSPEVIHAWMGLDEGSLLRRVSLPPPTASVPPGLFRLIKCLFIPKTIQQLSDELQVPVNVLVVVSFTAIILGWAVLDTSKDANKIKIEQKEPASKPLSAKALELLKKRVEDDFKRFQAMDFYQLLNVRQEVDKTKLSQEFIKATSRYSEKELEQIHDEELRNKLAQILSWLRLAYDTLREPKLREIYARQGAKKQTHEVRIAKLEVERILLAAIRDLEQKEYKKAASTLRGGLEKYPDDISMKGYLGWALFQIDSKENLKQASELLDKALERHPSDPHLWFFRGEISGWVGQWKRAERCFSQAVRLHPRFAKAAAAYEKAKEKRIADERFAQRA